MTILHECTHVFVTWLTLRGKKTPEHVQHEGYQNDEADPDVGESGYWMNWSLLVAPLSSSMMK